MSAPMTIDKMIEELRAGLDGVTPGPWRRFADTDGDDYIDAPYHGDNNTRVSVAWDMREAELRYFLACQPDNIRDLLDTLASKDKALAEAQEQAKHYPTVAGENMRLREEIAEIRAENERWCDAAQATSAKLTAANAELARVRKAIEAGKLLANAAFNIHQMGATDANSLRSLKEAQVAWDDALLASLAERAA